MYMVTGGVFFDTTFEAVTPGTLESYGPFATYEEAKEVWFAKTMRRVDICEHRLFISQFEWGDPVLRERVA